MLSDRLRSGSENCVTSANKAVSPTRTSTLCFLVKLANVFVRMLLIVSTRLRLVDLVGYIQVSCGVTKRISELWEPAAKR